jgi:hypothetical protein
MPIDGIKIVDGDGHDMEPPDLWSSRMDANNGGTGFRVDPPNDKRYVAYGLPIPAAV